MQKSLSFPRIGILCLSQSLGGLELNTLRFADWLQKRGWHITLFLPQNSPIAQKALENQLSVQFANRSFKYFDVWNASLLAKKIEICDIHVLLFTNNKDADLVGWVKQFCSRLKIIYQQQMQIGVNKKGLLHTLRFGMIDAWVAPLRWLAHEVEEKTRFNPQKVHIIPLGTELERFSHSSLPQSARSELKISSDATIIGIMGRIDPKKGQDFLIKAISFLNRDMKCPVELLIMGEPTKNEGDSYLNYLKELAENLGISDKIHFRGFTDKPEVFYQAIDIFAMASANETFGMVTIEAMASEVPVIATASGSNPEILRNGGLGLLYQPLDIEDFAQCVLKYLQNPKKTKRIAELAKREVQRKYSHIRQCENTEELIWQML